jgi:hypothetical protein
MPRALSAMQEQEAARRYAAGEESTRIARDFGTAPWNIVRAITRQGGTLRNKRDAALVHIDSPIRHLTPRDWHELYWGEESGLPSIPDLAKKLGVSNNTVRFSLLAAGISLRGRGAYGHKIRGRYKLTAGEIEAATVRYIGGESASSIARGLNCSDDCVLDRLKEQLQIRPRSKPRRLRRSRIPNVNLAFPRTELKAVTPKRRERQRLERPLYCLINKDPIADRTPTPVEIAWAAGFLEAEAYFSSRSSIVVHQTNREPLDWLKCFFGGTVRDGHRRYEENPRWSKQWVWTVNSERARGVALTVYSLMSPKRQAAIRLMIGGYDGQIPTETAGEHAEGSSAADGAGDRMGGRVSRGGSLLCSADSSLPSGAIPTASLAGTIRRDCVAWARPISRQPLLPSAVAMAGIGIAGERGSSNNLSVPVHKEAGTD